MRRAFMLLVFGLVMLQIGPSSAITGGVPDVAPGSHPNAGAVIAITDWDGDGGEPSHLEFWCSGSLLSPSTFLTAGHCVDLLLTLDEFIGSWYVTFDQDLQAEGLPTWWVGDVRKIRVVGSQIQSGFECSASSCRNDLAVLTLGKAVRAIAPIELPTFGFLEDEAANGGLVGHEFVNVGYGMGKPDRALFNPRAAWTWSGERERSTSRFKGLTRNDLFLLMNGAVGYGGVCAGDSGGPVYFEASGSYENLVVGVASFVDPTCTAVSGQERLDNADAQEFLAPFL